MKKALPVSLQLSTFFLLFVSLMFSAIGVQPARAATTWTVTSIADDGTNATGTCPDASACRLRKALSLAVAGDTIVFDATLSGQTIYLADTLMISKNIIIDGSALATKITISGDSNNDDTGDVRILTVDAGFTATLDTIIITKGNASSPGGGGILNNGTLAINNTEIRESTTSGSGGGLLNLGGTVTITDSLVANSSATNGGGIANASGGSLTITFTTLSENHTIGTNSGGGIINFGTLNIIESAFLGNYSDGGGGAIYNADNTTVITYSYFHQNTANVGGAIYNVDTVQIASSTFVFNGSVLAGGAINTSGNTTIETSTFEGNNAGSKGGAISSTSNTIITNSTFVGNNAVTKGGGIYTWVTGIVINSSTFSHNTAPPGNGGGVYNDGSMQVRNTIMANSLSGGDCKNGSGNLSININNLIEDGSCAPAVTGDPKLAVLGDNGGSALTMRLMAGSPAVDAGDDASCAASPVNNLDQRGVSRSQGGHCDIGAFESGFTSVTYTSNGEHDGWVLESSETSNQGQTINSNNSIFFLGDDNTNKQYRSILSFNTSGLPDTAVIASALLKIKQHSLVGNNTDLMMNGFAADVKTGPFGAAALQPVDFQTTAAATYSAPWAVANNAPNIWSTLNLSNAKNTINKLASGGGLTQIRLRFKTDDNNNNIANYISFFSGNAAAASKPQLIIHYYVP